jgi:hypothetical protein
MRVRLLTARATAQGSQNRLDEIEVGDAEAVRMIAAGQAEAVRVANKPEKAVRRSKAEKAAK